MTEPKKVGLTGWIKNFFLEDDGAKSRINLLRVFIALLSPIVIPLFLGSSFFTKKPDSSHLSHSSSELVGENKETSSNDNSKQEYSVGGVQDSNNKQNSTSSIPKQNIQKIQIIYRAKQVLSAETTKTNRVAPSGGNLIGKLLNTIDSRTGEQIVKVILPYGSKKENHNSYLPPNTILYGKTSFQVSNQKVLINFSRARLPDGREVSLNAIALDSKDYSIGLKGKLNGNTTGRTAAMLGLTMVGTMTETLVKKEALGQGFSVTPKASIKNGIYSGISKVANMEATRKANELAQKKDYITIRAGKALIVSILGDSNTKHE